jgi:hypothetical protein
MNPICNHIERPPIYHGFTFLLAYFINPMKYVSLEGLINNLFEFCIEMSNFSISFNFVTNSMGNFFVFEIKYLTSIVD